MGITKAKPMIDLIEEDLVPLPCWIEPAILPKRGTWLLGGLAKTFKSFMMLELMRALSTGTTPFNCPFMHTPEPCRVLLIEPEIGEIGLKTRVTNVFARHQPSSFRTKTFYSSKDLKFRLDESASRTYVREMLAEIQPNVLMLDTINMLHNLDINKQENVAELFYVIESLKNAFIHTDMSVIISHHFSKMAAGGDKLDIKNFQGSQMWGSAPDTITTCQRTGKISNQEHILMTRWTLRHGEPIDDIIFRVTPGFKDRTIDFDKVVGEAPATKVAV